LSAFAAVHTGRSTSKASQQLPQGIRIAAAVFLRLIQLVRRNSGIFWKLDVFRRHRFCQPHSIVGQIERAAVLVHASRIDPKNGRLTVAASNLNCRLLIL
jgi:hypothetical protein